MKKQSTIAERLIESGETESAEMSSNKQIGDQVKSDYLKCSLTVASTCFHFLMLEASLDLASAG